MQRTKHSRPTVGVLVGAQVYYGTILGNFIGPVLQAAVQDYSVVADQRFIAYGYHGIDGGQQAMRHILNSGVSFTAVLASNDESAIGAMAALRTAGLRVPQDIAIVGFDDSLEAVTQVPPLTTLHSSPFEMGFQALELLLEYIEGRKGVALSPYGKWSDTADDASLNTSGINLRYTNMLGATQPTTHFVVDTSRNGKGPWQPPAGVYPDPQDWCNSPGRGLGLRPTADTGVALLDAYLWVKSRVSRTASVRGASGPAAPRSIPSGVGSIRPRGSGSPTWRSNWRRRLTHRSTDTRHPSSWILPRRTACGCQ